jgi:metal-dependent HD superfamily phosphatase/phosphodiesterase
MSIIPAIPAPAKSSGRASTEAASVTLAQVKADPEVHVLITAANENLGVIGYTDHGFRHAEVVARDARVILRRTGYSRREQDLAAVSGYLHDIGNVVGRHGHAQSGALLAHSILTRLGATSQDTAVVMGAIGSHEDEGSMGDPVHAVSAALILADKADVHRSRVRQPDPLTIDIHDRVNYAATASHLHINPDDKTITLDLQIDTRIAPVMTYFEIFLPRMLMSRRAAEMLSYAFRIKINGVPVL